MSQTAAPTFDATLPAGRWCVVGLTLAGIGAAAWFGWPALAAGGAAAALAWLRRARGFWWLALTLLAFLPFGLGPILAGGEDLGRDFSSTGMLKDLAHMLAAVVVLGRALAGREMRLGATPLNYLFFAYFGWLALHAVNPSAPIPGFWSWRLYVEFAVFYVLAQLALRDARDVRRLLIVWFLLAVPLAGSAIQIVWSGQILEYYAKSALGAGARLSLGGLISTNYLALLLLPSVLGGLGMAGSEPRRRLKAAWLVLAGLSSLLLVLTLSRRAYLAALVGLAILAFFARRRRLWLGLGGGALLGSLLLAPAGLARRLSTVASLTDYSNLARLQEWRTMLEMVFADPLSAVWGLGMGRAGVAAVNFNVPGAVYGHNSYLVQLAELGLVGAAFLLSLLVWHWWLAYRLARDHRGAPLGQTAALLLAMLSAYAFTGAFGITFHTYPMNMLAWLIMGMIQALERQVRPVPALAWTAVVPFLRRWRQGAAVTALAALAVYGGSYLLPREYRAAAQAMAAADPSPTMTLGDEPNPFALAFADEPKPPHYKEELRVYNALRSKTAIHAALNELDLLPALFPDRWDERARRWRGTPPTAAASYARVWNKRVFADWQPLAGRFRVTAEWSDPQTAAALANAVMQQGEKLALVGPRDFAVKKTAAFAGALDGLRRQLRQAEDEQSAFLRREDLAVARMPDVAAMALWSKTERRLLDNQRRIAVAAAAHSPNHPHLKALAGEASALRRANAQLMAGAYPGLPAVAKLPAIQQQSRHLRKTIQRYDQMARWVEPLAAVWRVRAHVDGAALALYDPAAPPWRRASPARVFLAAAGAAFAGYLWLLWIYLAPYWPARRRRNA